MLTRRICDETDEAVPHVTAGDCLAPGWLVPPKLLLWFIIGCLVLAGLRPAGVVRQVALASPLRIP